MVPVGQGPLRPWPTTFVAHNRLRHDYLRTMSQLAAITSSGGAHPALIRLAAAVTPDRARIVGEASNFDAVDQMVAALKKDDCFKEVKKSKLRKKVGGKGVEFQLSMQLRCSR